MQSKLNFMSKRKKVADFMLLIQNGKPIPPSETMQKVTVGYFPGNGIKEVVPEPGA